ncbi:MAG: ferrous iron transport protein A [Oscillospiraceae bacterium]|nr:ferrous iron transport protein A [Oscillospiraceae bacterium]MBR6658047.1 ferrous iron transport protein A [Oscillospiraceae bacterium]
MKKGELALIKEIKTAGTLRQRLFDLGFVPGTKVKCVRVSPFGDPKAFFIRGSVIALRNLDSKTILGVKEP